MCGGSVGVDAQMTRVWEPFTQEWVVKVELQKATETMVSGLQRLDYVKDVKVEGNKLSIELKEKKDFRGEISSEIFKQKGVLLRLNLNKITLEDVLLPA